ncbi:DUF2786 domain-containing protein [Marinomonas transparens]|uniref:DUF2786 domain-containing protein n=1 Tax=Marinomonas transparens TaxID=2795388 RepID=A0A934JPM6_9GAMM|nr:DUF2786 domain-containing protein [Marinomonas transparens]MBJ7537794.1 DUF2786 domain-containing protein [Marinomonas transparens]
MSIRRRKKAIQKVVKLLNLATSSNASESTMALRHAESLIRQYTIAQRELPILQLCDRSMLYRVSWGASAPLYAKEPLVKPSPQNSVYQRRFSEKNNDPDRAYESVRTILDDMLFDDVAGESVFSDEKQTEEEDRLATVEEEANADSHEENSVNNQESDGMRKEDLDKVETVDDLAPEEAHDDAHSSTPNDNVIDAAQAFRPSSHEFAETLKTQYATSDPDVPFAEDEYWAKVYEKLADFDEVKIQSEIDALNQQLSLAQENMHLKKQKRYSHEQEEVQERSERARIEQSFEEAIERAFQARARSYEAWEERCSQVRMACLRDEQEAVQGYESINLSLEKYEESFKQHVQRKEDYRAAKIMHELRRHLALAVSAGEDATGSYEKVIEIMKTNGLSLKDLEFSDIKNKSLFIRLLERESALISDLHEREKYTEDMLDKFLTSSASKKENKNSENPLQHIQRLLNAANEGGQFETQKNLEQVIHLMGSNDISVRDIGYSYIKKYSVFIRLINWEAEQISFLPDREKFTTQILEEYIQHSVQKPKADKDQKVNR